MARKRFTLSREEEEKLKANDPFGLYEKPSGGAGTDRKAPRKMTILSSEGIALRQISERMSRDPAAMAVAREQEKIFMRSIGTPHPELEGPRRITTGGKYMEAWAARERRAADRAASNIHHKAAPSSHPISGHTDLLGLSGLNKEVDLLVMPTEKERIAANLGSINFGGRRKVTRSRRKNKKGKKTRKQ